MISQKNDTFALKNFEGPLDFLVNLIQKEEIDIYDISIQALTQQFLQKLKEWQDRQVDRGAEFIGLAAYLVWLKSKTLLPKHEQTEIIEEKEEDPHFEIIHHLLDYCRFKQAAKGLAQRQDQQSACFFRGIPPSLEPKKPLGIDHISLNELAGLFKEMMNKVSSPKPKIQEENWRVSDKIRSIRLLLQKQVLLRMDEVFSSEKSRLELIVIFLAVLELMKTGFISVGREQETKTLLIFIKQEGF